jgi:hypothetical protein
VTRPRSIRHDHPAIAGERHGRLQRVVDDPGCQCLTTPPPRARPSPLPAVRYRQRRHIQLGLTRARCGWKTTFRSLQEIVRRSQRSNGLTRHLSRILLHATLTYKARTVVLNFRSRWRSGKSSSLRWVFESGDPPHWKAARTVLRLGPFGAFGNGNKNSSFSNDKKLLLVSISGRL